jgi:hypothetical protein
MQLVIDDRYLGERCPDERCWDDCKGVERLK